MVLRRIENLIRKIEELGPPPIIQELAMTKRGLIIFVGATGTCKSSSLAAMIKYRNRNSEGHIISIEDPIEFIHQNDLRLLIKLKSDTNASYIIDSTNTLSIQDDERVNRDRMHVLIAY